MKPQRSFNPQKFLKPQRFFNHQKFQELRNTTQEINKASNPIFSQGLFSRKKFSEIFSKNLFSLNLQNENKKFEISGLGLA